MAGEPPSRSGALGDIGARADNFADYVTGLDIAMSCADLTSFREERALDDNVRIMLRYASGGRDALGASQTAQGHENGLGRRGYGAKGGVPWVQANPNSLEYAPLREAMRTITRGGPGLGVAAARVSRGLARRPKGYREGFATIQGDVALAIKAAHMGEKPTAESHFPDYEYCVKGFPFVQAVARSSRAHAA